MNLTYYSLTTRYLTSIIFISLLLSSCQPVAGVSEHPASSKSSVTMGDVLKTDYFDVTVNKVMVKHKIKDKGPLEMNAVAENGTKFLVLNVTFKNTDTESRMALDGSVHVIYAGRDYNFDKSETVMIDGYGLWLEQINPLITKTTNLVYKIPEEVTGEAYYIPGRANDDERVTIGSVK